ncbi:hypothetical protein [Rhodococcus erythropolis]|jgi:hypothetical protein|uniref:hypothetical protein n=1 Tax=Rhodococcus erythropolis TaxID=1833 RepID=UPI00087917BC|nr:hypothetical protein [Rhodococcus erythropolis]OFV73321.1 hypothetical protein RERY_64040 [Rhodococcus erythropolis]
MDDEVELVHDGEGLAVIGNPSAVERFLDSIGLLPLSHELRLDKIGSALDTGSKVAEVAAAIAEQAGRYVKLTDESAEHVKEFGLMPTKTKGISHAMLGHPDSISKWIQIEDGPATLLMNPGALSGVAGIMAQLARQQEAKEFKQLLVAIDGKLDDVRRRQRDAVLAKMDRVSFVVDEAMAIREHGGDRETTWGKVKSESGTVAEVQADALRAVEALADKATKKTSVKTLAKAAQAIEAEVGLWIAVLTRCFQLQSELADLELGHVLNTSPSSLDGHRVGIDAALQERRSKIISATTHLVTRLDESGVAAQANVLLHARAARTVVNSINAVGGSIEDFHAPFAVDAHREALTNTRWRDAVRDPKQLRNAAAEAGPKVVGLGTTALVGTGALVAVIKSGALNGSSGGE